MGAQLQGSNIAGLQKLVLREPVIADSSSTKAVNFSFARATKRFRRRDASASLWENLFIWPSGARK
jgi:hypothetical protein